MMARSSMGMFRRGGDRCWGGGDARGGVEVGIGMRIGGRGGSFLGGGSQVVSLCRPS